MATLYGALAAALTERPFTVAEVHALAREGWSWRFAVVDRLDRPEEFDDLPLSVWQGMVSAAFRDTHGDLGEMLGLIEFLDRHRDAVAYDLIALGLRYRQFPSPGLTWDDMRVIVRHSPQESAVARAVDPDQSAWGLPEQLLALVADYLAWLTWAQSKDGEKNRNKPEPIVRPGVEPSKKVQKIGVDPTPIAELEAFLGWATEKVDEVKAAAKVRPRDARGRFVKQ